MFSESIFRRKDLKWMDIKKHNRHGLGFEKIPKRQIRAAMPGFIMEEVDNLLAIQISRKTFDGWVQG